MKKTGQDMVIVNTRLGGRRSATWLAMLAVAAVPSGLLAQTTGSAAPSTNGASGNFNHGWRVGVQAEYSDNILRLADNEESGHEEGAFLGFDFGLAQQRWSLTAASNLNYRRYSVDSYGDRLDGAFQGAGDLRLIGDYLRLYANDQYGQYRANLNQPDSPSNREDYNVLTGGAVVELPLGGKTRFFSDGSWSQSKYGGAGLNSTRTSLAAGLRQMLSPQTALSLSASRASTRFDINPDFSNYDLDEASLNLDANLPRTRARLTGGLTRLHLRSAESTQGSLFRVSVSRELSARVSIGFDAGTDYTDFARSAAQQQRFSGLTGGATPVNETVEPFRSEYANLGLNWSGARYRANFNGGIRRERYEIQTQLNSKFTTYSAGFTKVFSQRAEMYLRGDHQRAPATATRSSVKDTSLRLGLSLVLAQSYSLEPYVSRYSGNAIGYDYDENRIGVSLSYSPRQRDR